MQPQNQQQAQDQPLPRISQVPGLRQQIAQPQVPMQPLPQLNPGAAGQVPDASAQPNGVTLPSMSTFMQALNTGQMPGSGSQSNSNTQMVENATESENSASQIQQNDATLEGAGDQQIPTNNQQQPAGEQAQAMSHDELMRQHLLNQMI